MRHRPAIELILALALAGPAVAAEPPPAEFLQSWEWSADAPWFGGVSGIEVAEDGASMTGLTDRSMLFTARISRDGGRIAGIEIGEARKLRSSKGEKMRGSIVDSEGLAVAADGTLYVSFEGVARVARYAAPDDAAEVLPRPQEFRTLPQNGALEALAIDAAGRLYTMPEDRLDREGRMPVYRWDGNAWTRPFSLPTDGRFLPVGADFGPDGRLYVLERAYNIFGFRARLRRWVVTETGASDEETLIETATGTHDNLEGVSIWRDADGDLRATLVSDDNFNPLQRSELVEYRLPE